MTVPFELPDGTVIVPGQSPYLTGLAVEKRPVTLPRGSVADEVACVSDPATCCGERPLLRPRVQRGCPGGVPGVLSATVVSLGGTPGDGFDYNGILGVSWPLAWDAGKSWWYGSIAVSIDACWQAWDLWLTPVADPNVCYATLPPPAWAGVWPAVGLGYWCWTARVRTNASATCWNWCGSGDWQGTIPTAGTAIGPELAWSDVALPASCEPFELSLVLETGLWAIAVTE